MLSDVGLIQRIRLLQYINNAQRRLIDRVVLSVATMLFLFWTIRSV